MPKGKVYVSVFKNRAHFFDKWGPCHQFNKGRHTTYKSFSTNRAAEIWAVSMIDEDEPESTVHVYTDGSLIRHGNDIKMGFACFYEHEGKKFVASQHLSPERIYELSPSSRKHVIKYSSSLAEICGVGFALKHLPPFEAITIFVDNSNAREWLRGGHSVNKPYIVDLVKDIKKLMERFPHVFIKHVKGHSGVEGNELVDRLAYAAASDETNNTRKFIAH